METFRSHRKLENRLHMYFRQKIAEHFAEHENNPEHKSHADVLDRVIEKEMASIPGSLRVAELGAGAHPDRYDRLFARLLSSSPPGQLDWVEVSPYMLNYAKRILRQPEYTKRRQVIDMRRDDILHYLEGLKDESLDVAILKYTLNYLSPQDLQQVFQLLEKKLKPGGKLIASVSSFYGKLRKAPTIRYIYKGQDIPYGQEVQLAEGDIYKIQFLKENDHPEAGDIKGARSTIYYHSQNKLKLMAEASGFSDYFLGSSKELLSTQIPESQAAKEVPLLVLRNSTQKPIAQQISQETAIRTSRALLS